MDIYSTCGSWVKTLISTEGFTCNIVYLSKAVLCFQTLTLIHAVVEEIDFRIN